MEPPFEAAFDRLAGCGAVVEGAKLGPASRGWSVLRIWEHELALKGEPRLLRESKSPFPVCQKHCHESHDEYG